MNDDKFIEMQDVILDAFSKSSAVNDTIWFDQWTTLYEQIMIIVSEYLEEK